MVEMIAKLTRRQSRALWEQVDEPPEPVYANVERQPRATSPHAAAAPPSGPVWETHTDASTGRPYYHDPDTGVTTWESPFETAEGATGPATSPASVGSQESLEAEWGQYWDEESRRVFFYNPLTGETVWEDEPEEEPEEEPQEEAEEELEMQPCMSPGSPRDQRPPTPETDYPELLTSYPEEDYFPVGSFSEPGPSSPLTAPPGWSCHISPDKQMLHTNHFTQEQWVRLEDQHGKPYFYKPEDSSVQWELPQRHPSKLSTPEYTVELKGASLSWAPKEKSSKKNVLESADLPLGEESEISSADFGSSERLGNWQEDDACQSAASLALSTASVESDLSRVRHKLRKFLQRRPTMQSLREKGYIKDQVFGCALAALCERERSPVPSFVQQCIRTVEARGMHHGWTLDIDGLYRISGHLATIQKLRYKVDHDERLDLDDGLWEDVHVITDALKLFFPELPEPLFPFSHFSQFIAAIKLQDHAQRSRCVRDLVRTLPAPNLDTLRVLFQHLCRVIEHGEQNRMSVQSVAIVFGPTLLRPETEETTVPVTMVFQNQVVELILQQCSEIFPPH
ncbi:rho GTPase-activating protein 27-like [Castor canadensis]|uniref:Rho GTPase-activating protein 27-like n=1 Tax=Castor canadensis TaxID=51338 RepID=A0AC58KAS9_CASCN